MPLFLDMDGKWRSLNEAYFPDADVLDEHIQDMRNMYEDVLMKRQRPVLQFPSGLQGRLVHHLQAAGHHINCVTPAIVRDSLRHTEPLSDFEFCLKILRYVIKGKYLISIAEVPAQKNFLYEKP